ncbi:tRNA pseudouridine(55) synthase TruB [Candidatus Saccharibacteria bacterium]|nr:tRNA pseudouridine(55) synthase TruB [Candidatus Saccharibacteria bacterium]
MLSYMNGILLVDKPSGWTSFDVVAKVRGIVRRQTGLKKPKVGHTGTLDPLATGLLVLVVGSYTKRVPELTKLDKTYEVSMTLGQVSTTGDEEGEKTAISDRMPQEVDIQQCLQNLEGEMEQTPPIFSAIKVNGQRAYKLARAGKPVVIEPRKVEIYSITDVEYTYPLVKFTTEVSSGTYIRTLVEDIGKQLDVGAYMSGLRRTKVGDFNIIGAQTVDDLQDKGLNLLK